MIETNGIPSIYIRAKFQYTAGFSIDLELESDAWVTAIVGESGRGKTTILHLVAGLLNPIDGLIRINQDVFFDAAHKICIAPSKRRVGYAFQDYRLFPHLSTEQNLRYGMRRSPRTTVSFDSVVEVLELGALLSQYPGSLSGGQKQRVAFGRAVLASPEILLLDEPWSAIDIEHRAIVHRFLQELVHEFKIPTLLVSHDPASVAAVAKKVLRI